MKRAFALCVCALIVPCVGLFAQPQAMPWADHYREVLPDGFDPWCGPVVGVDGDTGVTVARLTFADGKLLDIFYPPDANLAEPPTTVIFVNGNRDTRNIARMGRPWMRSNQVLGWGRLAAEHGLIAIAYETGTDPAGHLQAISEWLLTHGGEYGLDPDRVGLWACSAGCDTAVRALQAGHESIAGIEPVFAVVYYGNLMLRSTHNHAVPVFVAHPMMDDTVDLRQTERFVEGLRELGGSVEFLTHSTGRHAFDVRGDNPETRAIIERTLAFMSGFADS